MALKSIRPYWLRDGKAWCANCRRHLLARIVGTTWLCCPLCDADERVDLPERTITLAGAELLCGRCGRSALVPGPPGCGLECPVCDIPPWERERTVVARVEQPVIAGMETVEGAGDTDEKPDRPPRPVAVVRGCFFCGQTSWHHAEWRQYKWVMVCNACGNRLSAYRAKGARTNQRKGRGA